MPIDSKHKSARWFLWITIAGLICFVLLILLAAHSDREQMGTVALLTIGGLVLTAIGVLGLAGILIRRIWKSAKVGDIESTDNSPRV